MLCVLMLWMPCWGGMINGLLTLRGAWRRVADDPVLKFFATALVFYGLSTLDGSLLAIKSVSALAHFTDWPIAHVHVTQVYQNTGTTPIEAIYFFPGSTRSAVFGMKMTIGERTIVAKINKKAAGFLGEAVSPAARTNETRRAVR